VKNIVRVIVSTLPLLFMLVLSPTVSGACSPVGALGTPTWAPNAAIHVVTASAPTSVTLAETNWNETFLTADICNAPVLFDGASVGGPAITISIVVIPNAPCTPPAGGTCITRGQTFFTTATLSQGFLETISINLNSAMTSPAAITEVAAHEIGHTFGLKDCNGCALNSTVMVSNPNPATLPPGSTINTLIGAPGPTPCDLAEVLVISPGYLCHLPAPPPPGEPPCNLRGGGDQQPGPCSPVILDLSGNGFVLTSAAAGVKFDIAGTGVLIQMGWTATGVSNGFLALPGADGLVHNGKQLFGNFTPQPKSAHLNGFAALALYDLPANGGNGDGVIDSRDAIFSSLRLWIDANHDGVSQPEELHSLPSMGVNSISLQYLPDRKTDQFGNMFRYRATVNPDDPDAAPVGRTAYDVFFVTAQPVAKSVTLPEVQTPSNTGGKF
jgi:hypothetical protein